MKTKKMIILILLLFLAGSSVQAQAVKLKTSEKGYPFNPDYPDFYYGDEKIFLELIHYKRNADDSKDSVSRYVIQFSGMTKKADGTKEYIESNWGFDTLDEFKHYKNLIENKRYHRILLKKPKYGMVNCDILVQMHPRRKIPKL